jgi:hypothetical protein
MIVMEAWDAPISGFTILNHCIFLRMYVSCVLMTDIRKHNQKNHNNIWQQTHYQYLTTFKVIGCFSTTNMGKDLYHKQYLKKDN